MCQTGSKLKKGKILLAYIGIFFGTASLLLLLLILSAKFPRERLDANLLSSAQYLSERELFGRVLTEINASKIDLYADAILLNIAYHYDAKEPLRTVMESAYYFTNRQNENLNLLDAVQMQMPANKQYLRYWHGSIALVRPLLLFLDLPGIYVWHAVLLVLLTVVLFALLFRKKAYVAAGAVFTGAIMTSVWFVPLSLEYTWMFLLMLTLAICAVAFGERWSTCGVGLFFLVAGIWTNYLDFLTTETLTLTIPLLLYLGLHKKMQTRKRTRRAMVAAFSWSMGYVGMWVLKWALASAVLGESVMPYVTEHIEERLDGRIFGISPIRYLIEAIRRNIACLLPWEYGTVGALAGVGLLLAICYVGFVYRKDRPDYELLLLYGVVGLLPYLRYLVLHNHAYLHCFFTYRAQMATVVALVFVLEEWIDPRLLFGKLWARKGRGHG